MTAAAADWLDLRGPFDDDGRRNSIALLDRAVRALDSTPVATRTPLVIIDIGAGTGNSARWFDHHLNVRLAGREVQWVLVDADRQSLDTAVTMLHGAHPIVASISQLPQIAAELLPAEQVPGQLLVTCSAVLAALKDADINAITQTLCSYSGIGLFLLTINNSWRISPAHRHDAVLTDAFCRHQQRDGKLGAAAARTLMTVAGQAGFRVESGSSPWQLETPHDREFIARFFTERVEAAIAQDPYLHEIGCAWLAERLNQVETGLTATIDHLDVYLEACFPT